MFLGPQCQLSGQPRRPHLGRKTHQVMWCSEADDCIQNKSMCWCAFGEGAKSDHQVDIRELHQKFAEMFLDREWLSVAKLLLLSTICKVQYGCSKKDLQNASNHFLHQIFKNWVNQKDRWGTPEASVSSTWGEQWRVRLTLQDTSAQAVTKVGCITGIFANRIPPFCKSARESEWSSEI